MLAMTVRGILTGSRRRMAVDGIEATARRRVGSAVVAKDVVGSIGLSTIVVVVDSGCIVF